MPVNDEWERVKAHLKNYRENPEDAHEWNPYGKLVSACLLTVTGRKTGKSRSHPLIYKRVGDNFVLVGSKGGSPDHPQWFKNLMASPDCQIQVKRDVFNVRARVAEGAEREALWKEMVELLPQYAEYQTRTDRKLPVVVLESRAG